MPTVSATLQHDLATMRDSLGRLFDAKKFAARFDRIGRWVNARAGRKSTKAAKRKTANAPASPARPSPAMPTETAPALETPSSESQAAATPAPDSKTAPTADAAGNTIPPAPASAQPEPLPDFSDIERAAGSAPAAEGKTDAGSVEADLVPMTTADSIIGIIQTALVLIGDDEGILSQAEKLALRPPLERVLKKYNVGAEALPAEVDLAVALALIVVSRLQKPKTATFFAKVRAWFSGKVMESKGRALAARVEAVNRE